MWGSLRLAPMNVDNRMRVAVFIHFFFPRTYVKWFLAVIDMEGYACILKRYQALYA